MRQPVIPERLAAVREVLEAHGQSHVLRFHDELSKRDRSALLDQIEAIDFRELDRLIERFVRTRPEAPRLADLEPAPFYPRELASVGDADRFRAIGSSLVREGRVAAFTVAGGQGTRLGWRGPKGTYPATVVAGKPLFRVFAEQILAAQRKYRATIPWYIMTSPANDAETRAYFQDNNNFALDRRNVFMFPQGVMPSLDAATGRLLLADKGALAVNPDGHGGSIRALSVSGALEDMLARGVEHISYFQVDNPLVKIIDPLFLGLHAAAPDSSAQMSSKMVPKAGPTEKVGVFCRAEGRTRVIEYSDLPLDLAQQTDENGRLRFIAGSIAIHAISVDFVRALNESQDGFALPWHRADKKVAFIDPDSGRLIEPEQPNAVKLETFVFDALPLADSSIVLETSRVEEFAPIKNAFGVDSPATSHQLQSDRAGLWLEQCSVRVPRRPDGHVDAELEISPLTALDAEDLAAAEIPSSVRPGEQLLV